MQLLMAVLADRSDVVDGKANLTGIFQSVVAAQFPTMLHGVLAIRVALGPDDPELVAVGATLYLGGSDLGRVTASAFVPPASPGQPLRGLDVTIDLEGTRLPGPGRYEFAITVENTEIARVPLAAIALAPEGRA